MLTSYSSVAHIINFQYQAVQEVEMQERAQYQQRLLAEEENQKRLHQAAFATAMAEQQEQQRKRAEQQHIVSVTILKGHCHLILVRQKYIKHYI